MRSGFGHDKSLTLRPYAQLPEGQRPTMFYAGDGVSDLSAARETDLLFAKKGHDLIQYCVREDIPFTVFGDWKDILAKVKEIVYVSSEPVSRTGADAELPVRARPPSSRRRRRVTSSTRAGRRVSTDTPSRRGSGRNGCG